MVGSVPRKRRDEQGIPHAACYVPFVAEEGSSDPIQDLATRTAWSKAARGDFLCMLPDSDKNTVRRCWGKILPEEDGEIFLCDRRGYTKTSCDWSYNGEEISPFLTFPLRMALLIVADQVDQLS